MVINFAAKVEPAGGPLVLLFVHRNFRMRMRFPDMPPKFVPATVCVVARSCCRGLPTYVQVLCIVHETMMVVVASQALFISPDIAAALFNAALTRMLTAFSQQCNWTCLCSSSEMLTLIMPSNDQHRLFDVLTELHALQPRTRLKLQC